MKRSGMLIKTAIMVLILMLSAGLSSSKDAVAVSTDAAMYLEVEGTGKISGFVGSQINPYRFTLTVKKGEAGSSQPSFQTAIAAGADVTAWFKGVCDPEKNIFAMLPIGLTVKTVNAIKAGDTSAQFEISGTPYMGSSGWLQVRIQQSVFDGNPNHKDIVEVSNRIQFSIIRSTNTSGMNLSPASLKITGTKGTAISAKEFTVSITGGNFIREFAANTDVSDWFRGSSWIVNYNGEYMTAKLPEGMSARLKKAVKLGDTLCTFVISGTPAYGANEYIVPELPEGSVAFAGSDRNEHGYGSQGFGCNDDYMFLIEGASNKPGVTLESMTVNGAEAASITAVVGETLPDNLMTFRLKNCELTQTFNSGADITGFFLKWSYPFETNMFDGMGVSVKVVNFTAGNDWFTCKLTGNPKKNGSGYLTIKLFEEHTSAGVRMSSSGSSQKKFGFSTPSEYANAYISEQVFDCKLGFMLDTSSAPTEIEITQGYSTGYRIKGDFTKGQDVSALVSGLPEGVKAYSAERAVNTASDETNTATLLVYFKGIPTSTGTKKVYADLSGLEYEKKPAGGAWTAFSGNEAKTSENYVTINVTNASEFGFAYSFALDRGSEGTVAGLTYDELKEVTALEAINLRGSITSKLFVKVQNGAAAMDTDSVYNGSSLNLWLYIPQITFPKAYNEDQYINDDLVRLMRIDGSGQVVDAPLTGVKIITETALAKGTQTGVNMLIYIESSAASAVSCMDGLQIQIKNNGTWKNVAMPVGSRYEIAEVITGEVNVSLSDYNGITASVADCSINGITWTTLWDKKGVEVTLNGASFRYMHKGADVSSWFTDLPEGMSAVVREDAKAGSNKVCLRFGRVNKTTGKITTITPTRSSTAMIGIRVPFSALDGNKFANTDGYVIAADNANARYNILSSESFAAQDKIMVVSTEFTGEYNPRGPIVNGFMEEAIVYIPSHMISDDMVIVIETSGEKGVFANDLRFSTDQFSTLSGTSEKIKTFMLSFYGEEIIARQSAKGSLSFDMIQGQPRSGVQIVNGQYVSPITDFEFLATPYLTFNITEPGMAADNGDEVVIIEDEDDGEGENEAESEGDPGPRPDIWVNGKDNKKESKYYKSLTKEVSALTVELPDGCKYAVSVTGTDITDVSGAFSSGKPAKNTVAKATYKKGDNGGAITVTAGKIAGDKTYETVRVWIAAIDKKKAVQSSDYFDVVVGVAPKKLYLTEKSKGDKTAAVKSIMLNMGDTGKIYVHSDGTGLSAYAKFTWEAPKDTDGLLAITPSSDTKNAVIGLNNVPSDGKVKKIAVSVLNNESGKKISFSVMISNSIKGINGLTDALQLDSAIENAVEKKLDYQEICYSAGNPTTDKIKVYVTTALEEGSGYTIKNGKKFAQASASKSKVKVTYKNGEYVLKAPKKTADGTKVRVLIVATHADKSIDVFESGIITIGTASGE